MSDWGGSRKSKSDIMQEHVASVAIAIEAMETLLIERGVLKDNEVMDKIKFLLTEKQKPCQNVIINGDTHA